MKHATDLLGAERTEDGILQVATAETAGGCPHCGTVEVTSSENGRFVWWHAGAECCTGRLTDQLTWRGAELQNVQAALDDRYEAIRQLRIDAERAAFPSEAKKLNAKADAAERAINTIADGFKEQARLLQAEMTRLQKKRAWLHRQEQGNA